MVDLRKPGRRAKLPGGVLDAVTMLEATCLHLKQIDISTFASLPELPVDFVHNECVERAHRAG